MAKLVFDVPQSDNVLFILMFKAVVETIINNFSGFFDEYKV